MKALIPILLVGGFVAFSYVGYLDYTVREQFEGKRWSIPARVYASPLELYAGLAYSAKEFEDILLQLHYRQDNQLAAEGSYFIKSGQVNLKTRGFNFGDKLQESRKLSINFRGDEVAGIVDTAADTELSILRMEPIQIGIQF